MATLSKGVAPFDKTTWVLMSGSGMKIPLYLQALILTTEILGLRAPFVALEPGQGPGVTPLCCAPSTEHPVECSAFIQLFMRLSLV